MVNKLILDRVTMCVIELGYVGLPLAEAFSKSLKVIGFDTDKDKVKKLSKNNSNQNRFLLIRLSG